MRKNRTDGAVRRLIGAVVMGAAALVVGSGLGGCNANANQLMEANRALTDRNQVLTQENESLQAANAQLQSGIEARDRTLADLRGLIDQYKGENSALADRMRQFGDQLKGIKFGQLDPETDRALKDLARQYPDLIAYDESRGMVRFTSDLTFASGSDQVTEQGRRSLDAFAKILTGAASNYDVKIVGHTDSQRVTNKPGRAFKDNWELSAFRAISVMRELNHTGVDNQRLEIAGRGEWQPAVENTARGNTPQNRRVEIYLQQASAGRMAAKPAPATNSRTTTKVNETAEDIMK